MCSSTELAMLIPQVKYVRHMKRFISLQELRASQDEALKDMQLLRRPQLSVQRVTAEEWDCILAMEQNDVETAEETKSPPAKSRKKSRKAAMPGTLPDEQMSDEAVKAEIRDTHGGH